MRTPCCAFAAFDVADPALEPKLNGWVAAFPRSYAAHLASLQTRWGGSLNEMLAFMQETRKAGFSDDQLWTLEKLIDEAALDGAVPGRQALAGKSAWFGFVHLRPHERVLGYRAENAHSHSPRAADSVAIP
jgi:hypothetical protein